MKKSTKIISLLLAVVMVFSVIPLTASAVNVVPSGTKTVESLISIDGIGTLLDNLVTDVNNNKDYITGTVLRIVYLAMNNDDINKYITKEVTTLSDAEAAKVLVKWLDTDVLPPLQESLDGNDVIAIVNNNVPGLQIKIGSVQDIFDTLKQLGNLGITLAILGDAQDINVSAIKNAPKVAGNELAAVKAVIQFLKDNMGLVKKVLNGTIDLGIGALTDMVKDKTGFLKDLPKLVKSYLYKLIDSDAAAGEFADGKMGGDWEKSAYGSYNADELLGAALIKTINGTDDVVAKSAAAAVATKSFYAILGEYAEPVFNKFALKPLNEAIDNLNKWIAEQDDPNLTALFKSPIAQLTTSTFSSIFADAKTTGLLEQLNNILLAALKHIFKDNVYSAVKPTEGGNENLNANLTKIARYALPILVSMEDMMGYTFPDEIKNADVSTLDIPTMATYILKPFFESWFNDSKYFDKAVVNSAASLPALAVLAVNYTATTESWLNLDYDFSKVTANDIKDIKPADATAKVLETAAGIAIGAIKYNKDSLHFTSTLSGTDWVADFNTIENWGLDFISGMPALVRTHNIKSQNGYGAFYKLNVVLNELIDFSFLNDVKYGSFKLDLEYLLKSLCDKIYNFDVAGIIHIFEKNSTDGNILNGALNASVIGLADRLLTALFDHNCGTGHGSATELEEDPANPCTQQIKKEFDFCKACGAYFTAPKTSTVKKSTPTHVYGPQQKEQKDYNNKNKDGTYDKVKCNYQTRTVEVCEICGEEHVVSNWSVASHKLGKDGKCTVCGYDKNNNNPTNPDQPGEPEDPPVANVKLGDVDKDGEITAADARLALRRAVDLEKYAKGSDEYIACNVDKDDEVTAADARLILRAAVELEDPTKW